jgi:hypothetical protein
MEGEEEMIDIKQPEENEPGKNLESSGKVFGNTEEINKLLNPDAYYLKEISNTLKDILRELKKRKV